MILRFLFVALLAVSSFSAKAEEDYMNTIANECCKCMSRISDTLNQDNFYMELGLCMLKEATPYKKQLKKDYKIDIDNFSEYGEKFGEILGIKMAIACPEEFLRLSKAGMINLDNEEGTQDVASNTAASTSGTIQKIEEDCFVVFVLKDNTGKISKFYWLDFIDTGNDLISNYKNLLGKSLEVFYKQREFFDPKISEYRNFNVITKLVLLED